MNLFQSFNWFLTEIILLSILLLTFSFQVYYYLRYSRVVLKSFSSKKKETPKYAKDRMPVSVIIAAKDESVNLREFLPHILNQNYPEYEVLVVNDGKDEATEDLLDQLKLQYPHLRSTFVPANAKNISTKKLALSLGIKAAKYDHLLFTDADCKPHSNQWIAGMARNFTDDTEIVLGYGAYLPEKSFINKLITYDTLFIALQYLGFAKRAKPYMGVGRNMAYKKEVFYRHNGFAGNLHLKSGDDDLMVNRAANKHNTRIETDVNSITWSIPKKSFRSWYFQKERHLSVASFYHAKSKFLLFAEPFTRFVFYLSFMVTAVLTLITGNWIWTILAFSLFVIRFLIQAIIINKASRYYQGHKYYLTLLLFDFILPIITAIIMTFGRMGSKSKYINWKK